jgi:hypothetical protein
MMKQSLIDEWIQLFGVNIRDDEEVSLETICLASKVTITKMKNEYLSLLNNELVTTVRSLIDKNQMVEVAEKLKCF